MLVRAPQSAAGGLPDDVRVFHGTNTNLLTRMDGAAVDGLREENESQPSATVRRRTSNEHGGNTGRATKSARHAP